MVRPEAAPRTIKGVAGFPARANTYYNEDNTIGSKACNSSHVGYRRSRGLPSPREYLLQLSRHQPPRSNLAPRALSHDIERCTNCAPEPAGDQTAPPPTGPPASPRAYVEERTQ